MKQRFKEIITKADEQQTPYSTIVSLNEPELETAAENCASLTIEMMEKFHNWWNEDYDCYEGTYYHKEDTEGDKPLSTRELIDRFLSEQQ